MECNKDEAVRAKAMANMKLEEQDYHGAKKFVLKAQSLYPQLDGLSQLMATVDVYISASNKIHGEVDWYGVLDISHTSDDDTVKRQYRKLALLLHPDKNKSPGADGAFKLIGQAWCLLSDKSKRLAYNRRRCPPTRSSQNVPNPTSSNKPSAVPNANQYTVEVPFASVIKIHFSDSQTSVSVTPASYRSDTYWSICLNCKKHYEVLKIYLNYTFLCTECGMTFVASKAPTVYDFSSPSSCTSHQQEPNSSNHAHRDNTFLSGVCVGFCAFLLSTFLLKKF